MFLLLIITMLKPQLTEIWHCLFSVFNVTSIQNTAYRKHMIHCRCRLKRLTLWQISMATGLLTMPRVVCTSSCRWIGSRLTTNTSSLVLITTGTWQLDSVTASHSWH